VAVLRARPHFRRNFWRLRPARLGQWEPWGPYGPHQTVLHRTVRVYGYQIRAVLGTPPPRLLLSLRYTALLFRLRWAPCLVCAGRLALLCTTQCDRNARWCVNGTVTGCCENSGIRILIGDRPALISFSIRNFLGHFPPRAINILGKKQVRKLKIRSSISEGDRHVSPQNRPPLA
jgi:hypothetical protein